MVLECGGNGRSAFSPPARGNQWTNGGAGCAEWTGVRLADVLKTAGLKATAKYTAHYSADLHLSGNPNTPTLSRGVRIEKAMDANTLIVWGMNGQPLPNIHGGPVRLFVPGWTGSASQKWLTRITIRDKEHDGPGMTEFSYRLPDKPMIPGDKGDAKNWRILESMPVRSIITSPANGTKLAAGTREIKLRGASWAGDLTVKQVDVSTDFGATWQRAKLEKPKNKYDWQRWTASVKLPSDGYYEVWARATDRTGRCSRTSPATGIRKAMAATPCTASRCWSDDALRPFAMPCRKPALAIAGLLSRRRPRSRSPTRRATKARRNSSPAPGVTTRSTPARRATTSSSWRRKD